MTTIEALLETPHSLSDDKIVQIITEAIQLEAIESIVGKIVFAILFIGILILIGKTIPKEK